MTIDLFIPCFVDQFSPETAINTVKILERLNIKANYNIERTCCGQLAFNSGYWDDAKKIGEKFIKNFSNNRYVVSPSASSVAMVKNYYTELFHNTALHNESKQLQANIYELTDFLVNVLNVVDLGTVFNGIVTYHDPCIAMRGYGIKNEARELLKHVKGIELREMKESNSCCGFENVFSLKYEPISVALAEQKVQNAVDTGANYITSTEPLHLMHLNSYIKKKNINIKTINIADIISSV